jgi:hypothetical protein
MRPDDGVFGSREPPYIKFTVDYRNVIIEEWIRNGFDEKVVVFGCWRDSVGWYERE